MLTRKLLLFSLLTLMSWLTVMAQDVVTVQGTVSNDNGEPESGVTILISAFFADSTVQFLQTETNSDGFYTDQITPPMPNLFGWVEVSMVDCWGLTQSQYFTILNGNEVFTADFNYCEQNPVDSCQVFILQEWLPNGGMQLSAWTPPGATPAYAWSTGDSTQSILPQSSGLYCVTVSYPWGCVATDCIDVVLDSAFCFAYIVTTDNGDGTYNLAAVAGSGIPPFQYLWSTGETTSSITNVEEGTYCVTVYDATGCEYATCVIVDDNPFCEVYISEDPATGSLFAYAFGQHPITYLWSTGETGQVIYPPSSGLYCVTMTDGSGCETSSCYQYQGGGWDSCYVWVYPFITDSNTIGLTAYGSSGADSLLFEWSNGATGETIHPIDPTQTYCVTLTDSDGCVSTGCYEPANYCYAWINANYIDTNLAVLTVGVDSIFSLPGSPQAEFLWSDGSTGSSLTVTESGDYCVTVTVGSSCTTETCYYVDFESLGTSCSAWVYQYADSTGQWYAGAYAWGWGTFSYNWSNGDTNAVTLLENPNEIACVTVTSSFGCETVACTDTFFLPCEAIISINYISNSEAVLTATVWNDPSQGAIFNWSTGDTTPVITVTEEGTYCVTVMSGGCVKTTCVDVYFWNVDSCGVWISEDHSQGSYVTYTANAWGVAPFSYLWSNGATTQSVDIDFGIHDLCVTVTDAIGCASTGCNFKFDSCFVSVGYSSQPIPSLYVYSDDPVASVIWTTGDTLPWIEIEGPGQYCATVTTIFGCESTACIVIDTLPEGNSNIISGYVFTDSLSIAQGSVHAFRLDPNTGEYNLEASTDLLNGTFYQIDGLPDGVYVVRAELTPGSPGADAFFPTYHYSSVTWESAVTHTLPNWLPVTTDIWMVRTNPILGGGGVIGGIVTDGNRLAAGEGDPDRGQSGLSGVEVLIKDVDGNPLTYMWTLEDGSFRFTGLHYGTYRISYDQPGKHSPDVWVTLSPESPEKLNVTLVLNQGTTAVEDPTIEEIQLHPNPATHEVFIPVNANTARTDIRMTDMQGKVVYTGSADQVNGVIRVDIGSFTPGLYLVSLKSDDKMYYGRFVKQD